MFSHDTHHLFDWMASKGLNSQKGIPSRNIPRSVWGKQWAKTAVLSLQSTWSYKLCGHFKRNWVDKPLSQCCNDKGTRFCTGWTQNRSSHLSSTAGAWPPQRSWTQRATGRSPRTRTWRTRTGTAAHIAAAGISSFGRKTLSRSCQVWQYELAQAWRHPLSWKKLMAGKFHSNFKHYRMYPWEISNIMTAMSSFSLYVSWLLLRNSVFTLMRQSKVW